MQKMWLYLGILFHEIPFTITYQSNDVVERLVLLFNAC